MARPLKYTVKDVESMIDAYFNNTPESKQTVTGLAILFGSKQLLADYEKRENYSEIITTAKLKIENLYEQCLRGQASTGAIFALKNFGWSDKQEVEHSGGLQVRSITINVKDSGDGSGD